MTSTCAIGLQLSKVIQSRLPNGCRIEVLATIMTSLQRLTGTMHRGESVLRLSLWVPRGRESQIIRPKGFTEHWYRVRAACNKLGHLLGRRLAEFTATMATDSSRAPQRAIIRTVIFGTTVKDTRTTHAVITNIPEERSTKTTKRLDMGTRSVHSIGTGTASRSASVVAFKQLNTMKKDEDAVHLFSGNGWIAHRWENGKHIRLIISVAVMKPTMHNIIVNLSKTFCHEPNARRRYSMITMALRLKTCEARGQKVSLIPRIVSDIPFEVHPRRVQAATTRKIYSLCGLDTCHDDTETF